MLGMATQLVDLLYLLDEVRGLGDVINDTVNFLIGVRVNVRQEPVIEDIRLYPPCKGQASVGLHKVDQASLGVFLGTRSTLKSVDLSSISGLSGGFSGHRQFENLGGSRERLCGFRESSLRQRALLGNGSREE